MPSIEPTRIRIQFFNNDVGHIVKSLSSKYRSAFVEMAVITWLKKTEGQSAGDVLLSCGQAPTPRGKKTERVRIQFFDNNAGQIVQSLSSKIRPAFVEMVVTSWLTTKEGKSAAKAFLVRGQDLESIDDLVGKISLLEENSGPLPPAPKKKGNTKPSTAPVKKRDLEKVVEQNQNSEIEEIDAKDSEDAINSALDDLS